MLAVFSVLLLNSAVLLVQRYVDPTFLLPAGLPAISRLNGVTSFCYALGDASLALVLLLPAWGVARGPRGMLTLACVGLAAHAVTESGSRTALLAVMAAATLWITLRAVRSYGSGRRRLAGALAALSLTLLMGFAIAYRVVPASDGSALGRLKAGIGQQGLWGHLFATRLSSYPLLGRVMAEYPLSGVGAGLYQAEVLRQRLLLAPSLQIPDFYQLMSYAPNQLLNTGAELGIPAMVALALALLLPLFAAWRARRNPLAADLAISLLVLLGALQLGPSFYYNSEAVVFCWLIVGLTAREAGASGTAPVVAGEGASVPLSLPRVTERKRPGTRAQRDPLARRRPRSRSRGPRALLARALDRQPSGGGRDGP